MERGPDSSGQISAVFPDAVLPARSAIALEDDRQERGTGTVGDGSSVPGCCPHLCARAHTCSHVRHTGHQEWRLQCPTLSSN